MGKTLTIIIANNEGKRQVSSISENKIKHVTKTKQWEEVLIKLLENFDNK